MKKILLVVFILLAIFTVFKISKSKIGDIRPAILPSKGVTANKITNKVDASIKLSENFQMGIFANDLGNIRDLQFSPNGTLLASVLSGDIVALPDKDQDGKADEKKFVLSNLTKPHGIAFYNNFLYIAEEQKVVRYKWNEDQLSAEQDKVLFELPKGGNHVTRSLVFNKNGQMYVSIGSTCNVCNENHEWYAAVITSDSDGNNPLLFAKGLRNSVFLAIHPETDEIWSADMGRDFLGDTLPPEEVNIIQENRDYGWPGCYGDKVVDRYFNPSANNLACEGTESPVYKLPAHSAPLGLTFVNSSQFPQDWQGDLLIALHGSWNSSVPVGYKVVRLKVDGNKITGEEDFIAGFLPDNSLQARGRPVDLIFAKDGSLFLSDDKSGSVYKIIRS